jgi:hypothetical protein
MTMPSLASISTAGCNPNADTSLQLGSENLTSFKTCQSTTISDSNLTRVALPVALVTLPKLQTQPPQAATVQPENVIMGASVTK